jgi:hypothetical protein
MPWTPVQAADALYALLPHALSRAALEEYGIHATPDQAQQVTRELLSVNLFWVDSALKACLSKTDAGRVYEALRQRLLHAWTSELGLEGHDPQQFFNEAEERRQIYGRIIQEGGAPIAVLTETASILEADGAVPAENHQQILALLFDVVPEEEIGDAVQEFA